MVRAPYTPLQCPQFAGFSWPPTEGSTRVSIFIQDICTLFNQQRWCGVVLILVRKTLRKGVRTHASVLIDGIDATMQVVCLGRSERRNVSGLLSVEDPSPVIRNSSMFGSMYVILRATSSPEQPAQGGCEPSLNKNRRVCVRKKSWNF